MRLFLTPTQYKIPDYFIFESKEFSQFFSIIQSFKGPVALDLETSGLSPFLSTSYIRSISLTDNIHRCYAIDIKDLSTNNWIKLWTWLSQYEPGFLMHNALFDSTWCQLHGKPIKTHRCTSVMFRNLANEGYTGQSWRLKIAMTEILGWDYPNNTKLTEFLKSVKLGPGDMHLAPWDILGPYNALDAGATYQLYHYMTTKLQNESFKDQLESYWNFEIEAMIDMVRRQYVLGLNVNKEHLISSYKAFTDKMDGQLSTFFNQDNIKDAIVKFNEFQRSQVINTHSQFLKNGDISKQWLKKQELIESIKNTNFFNTDSNKHLQWLFFDELQITPVRYVEKKIHGRRVSTDNPSVDKKALPLLGSITKPLLTYRKERDKRKFIKTIENASQEDGKIHPFLTIAGTITGRLAGSMQDNEGKSVRINLQNIAKDPLIHKCIEAPIGYKIIYTDFSSLEPHVLCEWSKDVKLRALYLNDSPHDIYLWYGANTTYFGPIIRPDYPEEATKEIVAQAKKKHSKLRHALKIIVLGVGYNMGWYKLMTDINNLTEYKLSEKEAKLLRKEYFKFFPGVKDLIEKLNDQYSQNSSNYIINPRGRPMFTHSKDQDKLLNKFIQSGGHDCTQLFIYLLRETLKDYSIEFHPYDIDKHDSICGIFPDTVENELLMVKIYKETYDKLNMILGWETKLKGSIKLGYNMADFLDE